MPRIFLCLVMSTLLLVGTGCAAIKQPDPIVTPKQKTIGIFTIGSDIGIINGQQIKMNGVAVKNIDPYIPLTYLAETLGISADKIPVSLDRRHVVLNVKPFFLEHSVYTDANGVLCVNPLYVAKAFGYDVQYDTSAGRIEIMEALPINDEDLSIGGVRPRMDKNDAKLILGEPMLVKSLKYNVDSLHYSGLDIDVFERKDNSWQVFRITSESDKYATQRGVKVGDKLEKVFDLYGKGYTMKSATQYSQESYEYSVFPITKGRKHIVFFVDKSHRIVEISAIDYGENGLKEYGPL